MQSVISLANQSVEGKAAFKVFLKQNSNPTQSELDKMRSRIEEINVTNLAKIFTGEPSLESPHVKADRSQEKSRAGS